ncbi:MAG: TolC family protein [Flavobacteriales bacterium]|nr:TolC family protein [Flavobacteriales bacterium]
MKHYLLLIFFLLCGVLVQAQEGWTLQRCIDYAFEHNIQIQQSKVSLQIAEANKLQATGLVLPNLNASGTHGYNFGQTIDPFTNTFATTRIQSNSFSMATNLILFNGFQNLNSIKQAGINVEVQEAQIEKMQNDIALSIANSFLNVLFNREFLAIAKSNRDATALQADRIGKLVDAGQLTQGDLSDVTAQLMLDEANVVANTNSLQLAMLSLTQLLQLPADLARDFDITIPSDNEIEGLELIGNAEVAVNAALNNFPEVKGAQSSVLSAERGLAIARGGISPVLSASYSVGTGYSGANKIGVGDPITFYPQIGITQNGDAVWTIIPQQTYADFETKAFGDQLKDNTNQSLFFSLRIPLFNGFTTYTNIKRAEANLLNAQYNLDLTRQQLEQDVLRAYADAQASLSNYQASLKTVEASQVAFDFAKIRFEQGVINSVDYQSARIRLDNARATLLQNKYDYVFKVKVIDFYLGKAITLR